MIILAYTLCLAGFAWIGIENLRFRQSIRTTLGDAYSEMEIVSPESAGGAGKVLNSYYESVYKNLPSTVVPGAMLMLGSTVLLLATVAKRNNPEGDNSTD